MVFRISFEGYPRYAPMAPSKHARTMLDQVLDFTREGVESLLLLQRVVLAVSPLLSHLWSSTAKCTSEAIAISCMRANTCQYRLRGTFRISSMKYVGTPVSMMETCGYRLGITASLSIAPPSRCMRRFLKRTDRATSFLQASVPLY